MDKGLTISSGGHPSTIVEKVSIRTDDGECPTYLFKPQGLDTRPAIIFYMDGLAVRPALLAMASRLAASDFFVALPDLFYRYGAYAPLDPTQLFESGAVREVTPPLMASTDNRLAARDTRSIIDYLRQRADVSAREIGVTGYCMGGAMALTVAGCFPDDVVAAASFHGGNLATNSEDSPHLLAGDIRARVYVGYAQDDPSCPREMMERLEDAFSASQVDFRCELYEGARHGWTMTDFPVYDHPAAERHWAALVDLFNQALR
jgi:carboxymethylenebutenolidase